jgi:hypothetical protein
MQAGEWFRDKIYNSTSGKEEWKYYYINIIKSDGKNAEYTVYIIKSSGKVLGPRTASGYAELFDQLTKVSEEYACSVLKIQPPESLADMVK